VEHCARSAYEDAVRGSETGRERFAFVARSRGSEAAHEVGYEADCEAATKWTLPFLVEYALRAYARVERTVKRT